MNRATPELRKAAKRLLAAQPAGGRDSESATPVHRVCDTLRPHLVTLMGAAGFRALLARALALAAAEAPSLQVVLLREDGTPDVPADAQTRIDPEVATDAGVVLLARLLGLLEVFIGIPMTVHLMHEAWPKVTLTVLDFAPGRPYEKSS